MFLPLKMPRLVRGIFFVGKPRLRQLIVGVREGLAGVESVQLFNYFASTLARHRGVIASGCTAKTHQGVFR